jgi:hypothetical protein
MVHLVYASEHPLVLSPDRTLLSRAMLVRESRNRIDSSTALRGEHRRKATEHRCYAAEHEHFISSRS